MLFIVLVAIVTRAWGWSARVRNIARSVWSVVIASVTCPSRGIGIRRWNVSWGVGWLLWRWLIAIAGLEMIRVVSVVVCGIISPVIVVVVVAGIRLVIRRRSRRGYIRSGAVDSVIDGDFILAPDHDF